MEGSHATANYCCGGNVNIRADDTSSPKADAAEGEGEITSPPITIRFDIPSPSSSLSLPTQSKITFPHPTKIETLIAAAQPATFGLNGRNVMDESYRKASKLDSSHFSTNFHPADYGILDAIKQCLLPGVVVAKESGKKGNGKRRREGEGEEKEKVEEVVGGEWMERKDHWGVKAELYKLNVCRFLGLRLGVGDIDVKGKN